MPDAGFSITKQNTISRQNLFVADQDIPITYRGQVEQDYGILPPGLRKVETITSRYNQYRYVMVEVTPHRRDIVFRHEMKHNLTDVAITEDDYFSIPFPWMQFHMLIPSFEQGRETAAYSVKTFITCTTTQYKNEDQGNILLHLPNTTWPGNHVCIYGDALGVKNDHGMTTAKEVQNLTISDISNSIIASVFGSGWNMNVTSWPEVLPKEFNVGLKNTTEIDRHELYLYESDYHGLEVMKAWENKSIKEMLELPTYGSVGSVLKEAFEEQGLKQRNDIDDLLSRLWRP